MAAVGALAVGAAAIGRLAVGRARVRRLEIDELVVRRAQVGDVAPVARAHALDWIDRLQAARRAGDGVALAELFTAEATYRPQPFAPAVEGLPAIRARWEAERAGPDTPFAERELVALDGAVAVARVERAAPSSPHRVRALWVIAFAPDGRCRALEAWPFPSDAAATPDRDG